MKKTLIIIFIMFITCFNVSAMEFSLVTISEISLGGPRMLLPLGDSITAGVGDADHFGYRDHLQDEVGIGTYYFVGWNKQPESDPIYDVQNSGNSGERTDETEARILEELDTRMYSSENGIVLFHIGANDITQDVAIQDAVDNVEDTIDIIDTFDSTITIYVALSIPRIGVKEATNVSYNTLLNTMLEIMQVTKTNLYIVDMNTAFKDDTFSLTSGDWESNCMDDTIHPNDLGYQVMAKQWASCIASSTNTNCNGN